MMMMMMTNMSVMMMMMRNDDDDWQGKELCSGAEAGGLWEREGPQGGTEVPRLSNTFTFVFVFPFSPYLYFTMQISNDSMLRPFWVLVYPLLGPNKSEGPQGGTEVPRIQYCHISISLSVRICISFLSIFVFSFLFIFVLFVGKFLPEPLTKKIKLS